LPHGLLRAPKSNVLFNFGLCITGGGGALQFQHAQSFGGERNILIEIVDYGLDFG
jgi:hypothetical protein